MPPLTVAYLGNFGPAHSTENHVARAWEANGHTVHRIQEGEVRAPGVAEVACAVSADLFMWTQTYGLAVTGGTIEERFGMLEQLRSHGIPTVGFHLDRWWGLEREDQLATEPFFRCDLVVTADGGHQEGWAALGVNHVWLPPGVSESECEPARADPRMASDLAFVGSWRGGYHQEWTHRSELVKFLRREYRGRCRFWPRAGQPAVRGEALRRLYASVRVVVGDSCLVGGATRYWSDRIPESLGRGAFLLHPQLDGLQEHFTPGDHLSTWPLGDWDELRRLIGWALSHEDERRSIAEAGRAHVLAHHTYEVRVRQVVQAMQDQGLLTLAAA